MTELKHLKSSKYYNELIEALSSSSKETVEEATSFLSKKLENKQQSVENLKILFPRMSFPFVKYTVENILSYDAGKSISFVEEFTSNEVMSKYVLKALFNYQHIVVMAKGDVNHFHVFKGADILTSYKKFMRDEFELIYKNSSTEEEAFLNGKTYSMLPENIQRKFIYSDVKIDIIDEKDDVELIKKIVQM